MSNTAERSKQLFLEALERPPNERAAYIAVACGNDTAIRHRVEALIDSHRRAERFLETPAVDESAATDHPSLAPIAPGTRIGHYQLGEVIGRGGMGIVYLAEQDSPKRQVALKILRAEMVAPGLLERFKLEADMLGRLQHPGIAQVLEANTAGTESGIRPYFAMELIKGRPLTEHAGTARLTLPKRLDLLAKVCDAVHHAHQKGVIHRDLKPGNILVDESGQPKVLDFGVARLTNSDLQITTMRTDIGQLIGTVPYMSPEQVGGDSHEVDTRSDVYALGVVGYELLVGRLPYDMKGKNIPEAVRMIRETEPQRPSAANRALRGDVETIILKALETDKARRYQSAAELGADIRRYLRHEPIVARPHSALYHIRKFARRNRALVAGASIAALGLVAGTAFATWKAFEATADRNLALAAESRATLSADAARLEAGKVERINEFLISMLAAADPSQSRGREISVREILDRAAERIDNELIDEPIIAAALRHTIGTTYKSLSHFAEAEEHLRSAVELRRTELGPRDRDTLRSVNALTAVLYRLGRLEEAESESRRALEIAETVLGPDDADTLAIANSLALVLQDRGNLDEAEPLYRRILAVMERDAGSESPRTLSAMNNLAWLLMGRGVLDETETLLGRTLGLRRKILGDDHPETLRTMINLFDIRRRLGAFDRAEPLAREAVEASRRLLGDSNAMTPYAMDRMAALLNSMGELAEAERLAREALKLREQYLGVEHPYTLFVVNTLGQVLDSAGKHQESADLHLRAYGARLKRLGPKHLDTIISRMNLAVQLGQLGRYAESEQHLRAAVDELSRTIGPEHIETLGARHNLGIVLGSAGNTDEAESILRESVVQYERLLGSANRKTLNAMHSLAGVLIARDEPDRAEPLLRRTLLLAKDAVGVRDSEFAVFRATLGRCLTALGQYDEAEPLLLQSVDTLLAAPASGLQNRKHEWINAIPELYEAWNRPEKAAEWRAKLSSVEHSSHNDDGRK